MMIKPKEVQIANLGLLKPTQVATQVAARLGKRFTIYDHKLCGAHYVPKSELILRGE